MSSCDLCGDRLPTISLCDDGGPHERDGKVVRPRWSAAPTYRDKLINAWSKDPQVTVDDITLVRLAEIAASIQRDLSRSSGDDGIRTH